MFLGTHSMHIHKCFILRYLACGCADMDSFPVIVYEVRYHTCSWFLLLLLFSISDWLGAFSFILFISKHHLSSGLPISAMLHTSTQHARCYPTLLDLRRKFSFQIPSGNCRGELLGHFSIIYDLCWSADDSELISSSSDGTVRYGTQSLNCLSVIQINRCVTRVVVTRTFFTECC